MVSRADRVVSYQAFLLVDGSLSFSVYHIEMYCYHESPNNQKKSAQYLLLHSTLACYAVHIVELTTCN